MTPRSTGDKADLAGSLRVRMVAWSFMALLSLVLIEVLARFIFPYPEIRNFDRASYSPQMVSGPLLRRASLAHASFRVESAPDGVHTTHILNLYGFRDREWRVAKTAAHRVLVVGDSMVEGFLAAQDETVPRLIETLARGAGEHLEVWNLGVGGAGLGNYIPLIQDAVSAFAPDEIVLVFHANDLLGDPKFGNELVRSRADIQTGRWWVPRLLSVAARISQGQAVPKAWHQDTFSFFPAVPDSGNPWTRNGDEYARYVAPDIAKAMREGKFNPFNVGEVQGYEHYLRQPVDIRPWLVFLKEFLGKKGVMMSITYIPQANQTTDYYLPFKQRYCPAGVTSLTADVYQQGAAILGQHARSLGIAFQDLTPAIKAAEVRGEHVYWDYDEHMRPNGYRLVAQSIQQLRRRMSSGQQ